MVYPKTREKPKPKNWGLDQAWFHSIKVQVSQVRHQKTQKIQVGSGFGYIRVIHTLVLSLEGQLGNRYDRIARGRMKKFAIFAEL